MTLCMCEGVCVPLDMGFFLPIKCDDRFTEWVSVCESLFVSGMHNYGFVCLWVSVWF